MIVHPFLERFDTTSLPWQEAVFQGRELLYCQDGSHIAM